MSIHADVPSEAVVRDGGRCETLSLLVAPRRRAAQQGLALPCGGMNASSASTSKRLSPVSWASLLMSLSLCDWVAAVSWPALSRMV